MSQKSMSGSITMTTTAATNDEAEILEQHMMSSDERKPSERDISNKIKQGIGDSKRSKRHGKILDILEEFKGTKTIANIKTAKMKVLITHTRNKSINLEATRKGIANTFAEFCQDLYPGKNDERKTSRTAKNDLKILVTMMTMILKTMSKTGTSKNSPEEN